MEPRRFPAPWTVEKTDACFIVKDRTGMSLAYIYLRCAKLGELSPPSASGQLPRPCPPGAY